MRRQIWESSMDLLHFQGLYWVAWRSFIAPWFKCDSVVWNRGWCSELFLLSLRLAHMYHTCAHTHTHTHTYMPRHIWPHLHTTISLYSCTHIYMPEDICTPYTYTCIPLYKYTHTCTAHTQLSNLIQEYHFLIFFNFSPWRSFVRNTGHWSVA